MKKLTCRRNLPCQRVAVRDDRRSAAVRRSQTIFCGLLALTLLAVSVFAAPNAHAQNRTQIVLPVALTSNLDSKKLKVGDEVDVKTVSSLDLQNGSTIPNGAKIVGHVTESKSKSKGDSESSLGIQFDKIALADGKTLAVSGVMQAVGPNPKGDPDKGDGVSYGGSMNQGITHNANMGTTYSNNIPILNGESVGAVGMKNLSLNDGVLKSDGKTLKLDLGSQVLIRAQVTGS